MRRQRALAGADHLIALRRQPTGQIDRAARTELALGGLVRCERDDRWCDRGWG